LIFFYEIGPLIFVPLIKNFSVQRHFFDQFFGVFQVRGLGFEVQAASERSVNNLKGVKELYTNANAIIWP